MVVDDGDAADLGLYVIDGKRCSQTAADFEACFWNVGMGPKEAVTDSEG